MAPDVAVGSAVAVGCDVAVGCAVALGSSVAVGSGVPGSAVGVGVSAISADAGWAPGVEPEAAMTRNRTSVRLRMDVNERGLRTFASVHRARQSGAHKLQTGIIFHVSNYAGDPTVTLL
jgi:hypothetical protein